ncbi:hypothetical protein E4V42_03770 [Clostridium estertheticum]|uniref:Xylose isomerase-like TIM barrel domain-containing protein n=1 Tax=Clostridium estertheticum TaxID=238834 RepID=A0A5N7IXM3_9CLOT|nr:hypothetical protein [Clostridium estertheticum]MPQ30555.1 hypothetical protein [Clostridium estertheticum]MPQ61231.1 hypothetical protein [Clostridium estertheticum]
MRFLKKASIEDILGTNRESVTIHYKEIELFTTQKDINAFIDSNDDLVDNIVSKLYENNAIISAVHSPESLFKTSNDDKDSISTNYLSVCEVINDEDSKDLLVKIIKFSHKIHEKQWKIIDQKKEEEIDSEENNEELETSDSQVKHEKIQLIIHSGCEIGCRNFEGESNSICQRPTKELKELFKDERVQIVVENITPYVDNDNKIEKGQNCGWSEKPEGWNAFKIAEKLQLKVCVDICHIFASHNIMTSDNNYLNALDNYFNYIRTNKYGSLISLFHLSNYNENGLHGAQFQDNDLDNKLLEKIKKYCFESAPNALITLEVADGNDYERACKNFDRLMLKWSELHTSSLFGELIKDKRNKDIKQYFDDLYCIYATDRLDIFDLRRRANRIKKFVLQNTFISREESKIYTPFNFSKDSDLVDTALFKMQAYIYYTRFCNLAIFLSTYYDENSVIDENNRAEDFALALMYFMFNDDVQQIEYTGLAFKFNVDWLPRRDTVFRFNDGIEQNSFKDKIDRLKKYSRLSHPMSYIMETIRNHVQGDCCLFSCGRNFGNCLFKYCKPLTNQSDWTVRVYSDEPINFIRYLGRVYSIQAFIQKAKDDYNVLGEIDKFSFDMSRFSKGRGNAATSKVKNEENASSLFSLFRYYTGSETTAGNISSAEKTASISDGEVIFLSLPNRYAQYSFNNYQIIVLMRAYLDIQKLRTEEDRDINKIMCDMNEMLNRIAKSATDDLNITEMIKALNTTEEIINLLKCVSINEKNSRDNLLKLKPYDSTSDKLKELFDNIDLKVGGR